MNIKSSTDFLIILSESVGPIGAVFIFIGIIIIIVAAQALFHHFKKKDFTSLVNKEVNRILDKVDETEEDITVILELMRNMAQAIFSINKKMKYTLSDKDSVSMVRLITTGNLLLNIISQTIIFASDARNKPMEIMDLREHFVLELKNKWTDYIDNLNLFRAPLKIGDFIDKKFSKVFFNDDATKGEMGVMFKITKIVFNMNIKPGMRYSRIKTLFEDFSQRLIHELEDELTRIMN